MSTELRPAPRIGLTMRVDHAAPHGEARDALAQDWGAFLRRALPGAVWMPVPNVGAQAIDHARAWGLEGFIFTGGNDLGTAPERDRTERRLLDHALEHAFPVLGVCRGLQLIQHHFGGRLERCDPDAHVAQRHVVRFTSQAEPGGLAERIATVNSFHHFGVRVEDLAPGLAATAVTDDGWVEGLRCLEAPIHALMWHPERPGSFADLDLRLTRHVFSRTLSLNQTTIARSCA